MSKGGVTNKALAQYGRQMAKIKNQTGKAAGGLVGMPKPPTTLMPRKKRMGHVLPMGTPPAGPGLPMKGGGKVKC